MNLNPLKWFAKNGQVFDIDGRWPNQAKTFFSFNNKEIYFDLSTEKDYRGAFLMCPPVKAIIGKRASMFVNGVVEIVNKNTDNPQRGQKAKLLRSLLRKPNVLQSWKQFFAQFHTYIDLFGYCPVFKVEPAGMEGTGEISSIWCLPPWLFDIEFTGNWRNQTTLDGIYKKFTLKWNNQNVDIPLTNCIIVLDNGIGTEDDSNMLIPDARLKGNEYNVSNIYAAYKSRNTLITKKGAIGILSNIGKDPSGQIPLRKGQKEDVQNDFKKYGLTGQEWQVIVTEASLQWQSMTFPTKELMLFEEVEDNIYRLADSLGCYVDLIAKVKASTFSNLDEAKKAQYQDYIIPDAEARIEQLSPFILGVDNNMELRITYNHIEVMQENNLESAKAAAQLSIAFKGMYELGMMTKNQWLDAIDMEGIGPDGDKLITEMAGDSTPLAVKLGVGGVQALQTILVSQMPAEQKKQVLIIVFGINEADADKMAGEDPEPDPNDPNEINEPGETIDPLNPNNNGNKNPKNEGKGSKKAVAAAS